jgi:hypothetical protein
MPAGCPLEVPGQSSGTTPAPFPQGGRETSGGQRLDLEGVDQRGHEGWVEHDGGTATALRLPLVQQRRCGGLSAHARSRGLRGPRASSRADGCRSRLCPDPVGPGPGGGPERISALRPRSIDPHRRSVRPRCPPADARRSVLARLRPSGRPRRSAQRACLLCTWAVVLRTRCPAARPFLSRSPWLPSSSVRPHPTAPQLGMPSVPLPEDAYGSGHGARSLSSGLRPSSSITSTSVTCGNRW